MRFGLSCSPLCPWFLAECLAHSGTQAIVDATQKGVGWGGWGWAAWESPAEYSSSTATEAEPPRARGGSRGVKQGAWCLRAGTWSRAACLCITSCVTWGKLCDFSGSLFLPHL